jgi:hypothetical protein
VRPLDQVAIPDAIEGTVEEAIDRALRQRPDLMRQVEAISAADAQLTAGASGLLVWALQIQPKDISLRIVLSHQCET